MYLEVDFIFLSLGNVCIFQCIDLLCVVVWGGVWVVLPWGSEESVPSFHQAGPQAPTQVVSLRGKHLYLLRYWPGLHYILGSYYLYYMFDHSEKLSCCRLGNPTVPTRPLLCLWLCDVRLMMCAGSCVPSATSVSPHSLHHRPVTAASHSPSLRRASAGVCMPFRPSLSECL